jgi:enediyne biosynthesis protein E3
MPSAWRALRRRILTPGMANTKLSVRGFHEKDPAARDLLETVGRTFLEGYAHAAEARTPDEPERHLERIPRQFRGFAYEGAAMGFAVRDGLPFGRGGRTVRFLNGAAQPHSYMIYVGAGWAMARVPRFRWARLDLGDPLLRWLALDGYGFHQAYFHTGKYVHEQYREPDFPWPADGPAWYADHGIDQGIGRAMWFVGGADPQVVADLIDSFPAARQPDLYSGAGLAATYAGGGDEAELRMFRSRAGACLPNVAQGSAFAATARVEAGLAIEHTALATRVFCEMTPEEATRLCGRTRPAPTAEVPEHPGVPSFEVWRRRITAAFVTDAEVPA